MKRSIIYAGTSIDQNDAREIFDTEYRSPIKRGDLYELIRLIKEGEHDFVHVIGIIDGAFFDRAAVAHKEIMAAMDMGIKVVGGCSMGALRAFELADFGMIGVGDIYQWFKNGDLIADDELAVTYDPQTLQPLSEPLVNIRETFKAALSRGVVTEEEYGRLLDVVVAIFYPERTYKNIMNHVEEQDILSHQTLGELRSFIMHSAVDVKRADAVRVIKKVAEMCM